MLIEHNVPMAPLTTFQTGGSARFFVAVKTLQDIQEAIRFAKEQGVRILPLGSGSNVLFPDNETSILVAKNEILGHKVVQETDRDLSITVGAGESWDGFVEYAVNRGWYGVENLSLIPGTVGAAPVQNIGAYGSEVGEVIDTVQAVHLDSGEVKVFSKEECAFAYRDSVFKREPWFITAVTFRLEKSGRVNIGYKDLKEFFKDRYSSSVSLAEIRETVISIRKNKLPDVKKVGTAGSFFKNPIITSGEYTELQTQYPELPGFPSGDKVKVPLAWILDKVLNLKGYRDGAVGLFETQPLALVNYGGATTQDILHFSQKIEALVLEKTGIILEKEVVVMGA